MPGKPNGIPVERLYLSQHTRLFYSSASLYADMVLWTVLPIHNVISILFTLAYFNYLRKLNVHMVNAPHMHPALTPVYYVVCLKLKIIWRRYNRKVSPSYCFCLRQCVQLGILYKLLRTNISYCITSSFWNVAKMKFFRRVVYCIIEVLWCVFWINKK